jgi:hypothetical protein
VVIWNSDKDLVDCPPPLHFVVPPLMLSIMSFVFILIFGHNNVHSEVAGSAPPEASALGVCHQDVELRATSYHNWHCNNSASSMIGAAVGVVPATAVVMCNCCDICNMNLFGCGAW